MLISSTFLSRAQIGQVHSRNSQIETFSIHLLRNPLVSCYFLFEVNDSSSTRDCSAMCSFTLILIEKIKGDFFFFLLNLHKTQLWPHSLLTPDQV